MRKSAAMDERKQVRKQWAGEKSFQVSPSWLTAFGVRIGSRYGNAAELIELLRVAKRLAEEQLEERVLEIHKDSKSGFYNVILKPGSSDQLLEEAIVEIIQEEAGYHLADGVTQAILQEEFIGIVYGEDGLYGT